MQRMLFVPRSSEKKISQIAQKAAPVFIVIKDKIALVSLYSSPPATPFPIYFRLPFSLSDEKREPDTNRSRKPLRKHFTQIKKVQQRASLTLRYAQARGISAFQLNREFKLLTTLTAIEKKQRRVKRMENRMQLGKCALAFSNFLFM